jgi:hypothetical protein
MPPAELPPEFRDEPFLVGRARDAGLSRRRLGSRDLARPFRGLRVVGDEPTTVSELCQAYAARMPPTHVFSHLTAAGLHGMPLPPWASADLRLHVTVPASSRPPQMRGIIGHQLRASLMDVELHGGLPVTSPLQTWLDLGTLLYRGDLVAAADALCAGREPRYTPPDLRVATAALVGRRGCRRLREAAVLTRARVDSAKETEVRLLLLDAGIPEPVVNLELTDEYGRFVARVDLAWPTWRLCLEYEGDGHRTDRAQFRSDITRRERIEDLDWRMIRVTDDDLRGGGRELIGRVQATLTSRGWRG